jgi:hypothetical protein
VQVGEELKQINRLMFALDAVRMVGGRMCSERAPLFVMNAQKQMVMPDVVYISPISSANV